MANSTPQTTEQTRTDQVVDAADVMHLESLVNSLTNERDALRAAISEINTLLNVAGMPVEVGQGRMNTAERLTFLVDQHSSAVQGLLAARTNLLGLARGAAKRGDAATHDALIAVIEAMNKHAQVLVVGS